MNKISIDSLSRQRFMVFFSLRNMVLNLTLSAILWLVSPVSYALDVQVGGPRLWVDYLANAELIRDTQTTESNFLIPLGKNQKVDGRWLLPKSKTFDGVVYRSLYRFDGVATLSQLTQAYEKHLQSQQVDVFYQCASRSCGSSNFWANDFFVDNRLYGPDRNQQLWVFQQDKQWRISYLVQRGNGRIYMQQLSMGIEGATPDTFALGNTCVIDKANRDLYEFIQGAELLSAGRVNREGESTPVVAMVLTVSVNTGNAWQDSEAYASACALRLQESFDVAVFESLGLGSMNFRFDKQVSEAQYILHRFSSEL